MLLGKYKIRVKASESRDQVWATKNWVSLRTGLWVDRVFREVLLDRIGDDGSPRLTLEGIAKEEEERKVRAQKEREATEIERAAKADKARARNKKRAFKVYTKEELHPYCRLPKIYGEMEYARNLPRKTLTFFDIPTELRVKIYRYALLFDRSADFMPATPTISRDHYMRTKTAGSFRAMVKRRRLNLGFLRTCRKIHAEGSEVFYGENDFRVSCINGHMIANLFVRKIYKQHFQWLTTLTIPMPFRSNGKDGSWSNGNPFSNRTYDMVSRSIPFKGWYKSFKYKEAFEHLVGNLLSAIRFKKLVLVLPAYYEMEEDIRASDANELWESPTMWRTLKELCEGKARDLSDGKLIELQDGQPALQIDIVRLYNVNAVEETEWVTDTEFWEASPPTATQKLLLGKLKTFGNEDVKVNIRGAYVHEDGDWKVIEELEEDAVFPRTEVAEADSAGEEDA